MPTYEYKCGRCGHRFEQFQNMSDTPIEACPECGGKVDRLLGTGAGFLVKGSGFNASDYAEISPSKTRCGRSTTCCGRETPCDKPPCGDT
ncbi:MAG: zinc ribbon domain-containing protein [Chitinispirillaceae bacterium]|nr:zinc ribbon domain-containing protein [Chitinispirillaceae bacterium]